MAYWGKEWEEVGEMNAQQEVLFQRISSLKVHVRKIWGNVPFYKIPDSPERKEMRKLLAEICSFDDRNLCS